MTHYLAKNHREAFHECVRQYSRLEPWETPGRVVPPGVLPRLLQALEACSEVTLDGSPVQVSSEPIGAVGRVIDQNDGVRLFVEQDPAITELFANGAALCGDTLRPLREMRLSAREREQLPHGRIFGPGEMAVLVVPPTSVRLARVTSKPWLCLSATNGARPAT